MSVRFYLFKLSDSKVKPSVIRIEADDMEQDEYLYRLKRNDKTVGEVNSGVVAWWIEEEDEEDTEAS